MLWRKKGKQTGEGELLIAVAAKEGMELRACGGGAVMEICPASSEMAEYSLGPSLVSGEIEVPSTRS